MYAQYWDKRDMCDQQMSRNSPKINSTSQSSILRAQRELGIVQRATWYNSQQLWSVRNVACSNSQRPFPYLTRPANAPYFWFQSTHTGGFRQVQPAVIMLTTSSQATRESFSSVPKPSTKTAENAPVSIQDKRDEIPDIKNDNVETTTETPAVPIVNPTKRKRSLSRPTSQRKRVDVDTSCRSEKGDKFTDIMKGKPGVGGEIIYLPQCCGLCGWWSWWKWIDG